MNTDNPEIIEFIEQLQAWHKNRTDQLNLIVGNDDDLKFNDVVIEGTSEQARGIRAGISLSLKMLGELPFSLEKSEETDV